jgi:hypothetical protein
VTASADSLHLLAHRAQRRARTAEDWWDNPLDTALAAVSATRHPPAFRRDAETAVRRLARWRRDGGPRRVSADAAALALAARAAADLARRDRDLERAAADAVWDLAERSAPAAPALHVALAAWALDPLIADRDTEPWPKLRAHGSAAGRDAPGLDGPLHTLTRALAAERPDAAELVRELLVDLPASPGTEDGAVLLWTMTVAVERCAPQMSSQDSGLRALIDRRGELAVRLAQEITAETFEPPAVADFDPDAALDVRPVNYLSPMEALLLDMSLASGAPEEGWLRFEEARALFGQREATARRQLAGRTATLTAALGVTVAALTGVAAAWLGLTLAVTVPAALAVAWAFWLAATTVVHRSAPSSVTQALGLLWATLMLAAGFVAVNQALTHPLLGDLGGFVAGGVLGAVGAVIWQITVVGTGRPAVRPSDPSGRH